MKPTVAKSSMYIDSDQKNKEGPKFKFGDNVRISKYKNIFVQSYIPKWSEEAFVIKKVKNTVPWTDPSVIIKVRKLLECFTKKNYKKQIKESLELRVT